MPDVAVSLSVGTVDEPLGVPEITFKSVMYPSKSYPEAQSPPILNETFSALVVVLAEPIDVPFTKNSI